MDFSPRRAKRGLLVLAVDTSSHISSVRISKAGGSGGGMLNYLDPAHHPAGTPCRGPVRVEGAHAAHGYAASATSSARIRVRVSRACRQDHLCRRAHRPGDVAVAGQLPHQAIAPCRSSIGWETTHPALYRDYQLTFSGHYPTRSHSFTAPSARRRLPVQPNSMRRAAPKRCAAADSETLWAPGHVEDIASAPMASLLAESNWIREGVWALRLIDLKAGVEQILGTTAFAYDELEWKDDAPCSLPARSLRRLAPDRVPHRRRAGRQASRGSRRTCR